MLQRVDQDNWVRSAGAPIDRGGWKWSVTLNYRHHDRGKHSRIYLWNAYLNATRDQTTFRWRIYDWRGNEFRLEHAQRICGEAKSPGLAVAQQSFDALMQQAEPWCWLHLWVQHQNFAATQQWATPTRDPMHRLRLTVARDAMNLTRRLLRHPDPEVCRRAFELFDPSQMLFLARYSRSSTDLTNLQTRILGLDATDMLAAAAATCD
jgi:hypothetical protein